MTEKKRYRLRDMDINRVDLVDRGANQHAHIVFAKSVHADEKRKDLSGKLKARNDASEKPGMAGPLAPGRPPAKKKGKPVDSEAGTPLGAKSAPTPGGPPVAPPPSPGADPKAALADKLKQRQFGKHYGPGNHESGSSQKEAHGGDGGLITPDLKPEGGYKNRRRPPGRHKNDDYSAPRRMPPRSMPKAPLDKESAYRFIDQHYDDERPEVRQQVKDLMRSLSEVKDSKAERDAGGGKYQSLNPDN